MAKLVVGQKLWLVPSHCRHGSPHEVSVVSVGRKWATLDCWRGARVDVETLVIDGNGYSSPGRCYLSREEHEATTALRNVWGDFRDHVARLSNRPEAATKVNIHLAADLLGIQLIQE